MEICFNNRGIVTQEKSIKSEEYQANVNKNKDDVNSPTFFALNSNLLTQKDQPSSSSLL